MKDKKQQQGELKLFAFAINLGFRIIIPLLLLVLAGIALDNKYDSSPLFLLIGVGVSFFVTTAMVYTQSIKTLREMDKNQEKAKSSHSKKPRNPQK